MRSPQRRETARIFVAEARPAVQPHTCRTAPPLPNSPTPAEQPHTCRTAPHLPNSKDRTAGTSVAETSPAGRSLPDSSAADSSVADSSFAGSSVGPLPVLEAPDGSVTPLRVAL